MKLYKLTTLLSFLLLWTACSDNDEKDTDQGKPTIDITVSPQGNISYGDEITVQGTITDERNLGMYTISVSDQAGNLLTEKLQMLLGKTFEVNEKITIPLIAGATNGSLNVKFSLKNSREGTDEKEFQLSNVNVPQFEQLYLILENGTVYEMARNGNTYEIESSFAANARGYFSTSTKLTGLYWGTQGGEITSLGKDPIVVGHDIEATYKITFNPYTFDLTLGKYAVWSPLPASDCYYILGTISGHWQDGEITTERAKMKMTGYHSDQQRYYSWIPPQGDDPETGMWGEIAAGNFRLKRGSEDRYIVWDGQKIAQATTNDTDKSFYTSSGGPLEIRVYFKDDECTAVQLLGEDRTLEFGINQVKVNGISIEDKIEFAGAGLALKPGYNYIYESQIPLQKGQTISSSSVDLKKLAGDNDLFNGIGNATWTPSTVSGTYNIRIDLFSGAFYACPTNGYPDVIYLNGWSWAKTPTSNAVVWDPAYELALTHVGNNIYESTFYDFGWGGSYTLSAAHPQSAEAGQDEGAKLPIPETLFTDKFAFPTGVGRYKISVNLKEGLLIDGKTVQSKNNQKLTVSFTAL